MEIHYITFDTFVVIADITIALIGAGIAEQEAIRLAGAWAGQRWWLQ